MKFSYKKADITTTETKSVKLSPPWITYVKYIKALFENDPQIVIDYSEGDYVLTLIVNGIEKYQAISTLLPNKKEFGNVVLTINEVQSPNELTDEELFRNAFNGNDVLSDFKSFDTPFGPQNYAVFKKEVVQFYDDNMGDINGLKSTLYEEIAREVFGEASVHFCTSME